MLEGILGGLSYMVNPLYWAAVFVAVVLAVLVSLIPGVSSILVMALAIPFIIINIEDPVIGIVLLATIGGINNTLDSIPAILMGNPSATTQVTFLEGTRLADRGLAAYTLGGVYAVSALGGVIGAIVLALIIPVIRPVVLRFGPAEVAMLALFGVVMVAALSRGALIKGLTAGFAGILLGTFGTAPAVGQFRYTFDQIFLWDGLPLIATTLGLFSLPEMIDLAMRRRSMAPKGTTISSSEVWRGARDGMKEWKMTIRQSLFGVFLGAVPGIGSGTIDWLSYIFGIAFTKDKSEFGQGSFQGVLFAESAQNAKEGGQAVPSLTLGVPGGISWALILAAMMMYDLFPGPMLLERHLDLIIVIVITFALGNLAVTMVGMVATGTLAKLSLIPFPMIAAVIIPVALLAAFAGANDWLALPIVFAFGAVGFVMKMFAWPRPPMIVGFVLGPIVERNLQLAYSLFGWDGIATRPLTVGLFLAVLIVGFVFYRMSSNPVGASTAPLGAQGNTGEGEVILGAVRPGDSPSGAPSAPTVSRGVRVQLVKWENVVALAVIAAALLAYSQTFDFHPRARTLPQMASLAMMVLATIQLLRQVFRPTAQGEIFDIGIRSRGAEGATRTGLKILGLLFLLVFISALLGLRWGILTFSALLPIVIMEGKHRWIGSGIAVAIVAVFTLIILDNFTHVIWPQPALGRWILNLF